VNEELSKDCDQALSKAYNQAFSFGRIASTKK